MRQVTVKFECDVPGCEHLGVRDVPASPFYAVGGRPLLALDVGALPPRWGTRPNAVAELVASTTSPILPAHWEVFCPEHARGAIAELGEVTR